MFMSRKPLIRCLLALVSVSGSNSLVAAATTATLYNGSNKTVQMFLKWSDAPESACITMAPGQMMHCWSPNNSATLAIRFNDNPGGPVKEEKFKLDTVSNVSFNSSGKYSAFLLQNGKITLYHAPNLSKQDPKHVGGAVDKIQGGKVNGQIVGAGVGAAAAGFFSDGDPQATIAGAKAGYVVGGGMPAIKHALSGELGF